MADDQEGTVKPATAVDEASSNDYADGGGEAEDGDYDDEDEDDGADFDADDESDVDADSDSAETTAPDAIAELPLRPPARKSGTLLIVSVFVAIVGVFAYFKLRTPEEVVPPAVWARYNDVANTFSLELPAQPIQSSDPQATLMVKLGSRDYAVTWAPIAHLDQWKAIETAVVQKGTITRQLSIPDSDAAFVFKTPQGLFAALRAVRRDNVGYLIISGAYIDDPDLERPLRTFRFEPAPP